MTNLLLVLKGMTMGVANVIPGISGGTIAFITGIYERLITSLKKIDGIAIKLFFKGKWDAFAHHLDFWFLFWLFLGVGISIFSLARLLEWVLAKEEVLAMAFFFGLILASIRGVGKQIEKINMVSLSSFVFGCVIAIMVAFLPPATENDSFFYLMLCGVAAVSSMILPGLSGSYILLLMGNYALVLGAISGFDFRILLPILIGVIVGLLMLSRLLDWLFKKFRDATIATLTGFVAGSLLIIWPWKNPVTQNFDGIEKPIGYEWLVPEINSSFFLALGLIVIGFFIVWWIDEYEAVRES